MKELLMAPELDAKYEDLRTELSGAFLQSPPRVLPRIAELISLDPDCPFEIVEDVASTRLWVTFADRRSQHILLLPTTLPGWKKPAYRFDEEEVRRAWRKAIGAIDVRLRNPPPQAKIIFVSSLLIRRYASIGASAMSKWISTLAEDCKRRPPGRKTWEVEFQVAREYWAAQGKPLPKDACDLIDC